MENVLFNAQIRLDSEMSDEAMERALLESFNDFVRIYSYIVCMQQNEAIKIYNVKYIVSQTDRNNTIPIVEAIPEILAIVKSDKQSRIIGYRQPDIDVLIELLQPMVHKLAKEQLDAWKQYEYEDLCQMCNLAIVELYHQGYYVHRSIVRKTFSNMVLMELRKERDKPIVVPLTQTFNGDEDLEKLTFADILVDEEEEISKQEQEERDQMLWTFEEVKQLIIDLIGPRQFDQLFRDYGKKHTTSQTRRMMQKIKTEFARKGVTRRELEDKYYGKK